MSPLRRAVRRPRRRMPRTFALVLVAALVPAAAACSASSSSFDPSAPCTVDVRLTGAFPDLEALVPRTLDEAPPDRLDSGRNCTPDNLGSLADHGITEVRFAGGLWERGAESGTTLAVFTADGLTAELMGEFYEEGARAGRKTSGIEVTRPTIDGRTAHRMDLVNNGMLQTIVALDTGTAGLVEVALVSSAARDVADESAHETAVSDAIAAWTG